MIVRSLEKIVGTDADVRAKTWSSRRLLLKQDGMGFSMHDTILYAGTSTRMWYKNHLEAVYCIEGKAELEELDSGKVHQIEPGILYALNEHDRHVLHVKETVRMVCVFNPPLTGQETHDAEGSYPLIE